MASVSRISPLACSKPHGPRFQLITFRTATLRSHPALLISMSIAPAAAFHRAAAVSCSPYIHPRIKAESTGQRKEISNAGQKLCRDSASKRAQGSSKVPHLLKEYGREQLCLELHRQNGCASPGATGLCLRWEWQNLSDLHLPGQPKWRLRLVWKA